MWWGARPAPLQGCSPREPSPARHGRRAAAAPSRLAGAEGQRMAASAAVAILLLQSCDTFHSFIGSFIGCLQMPVVIFRERLTLSGGGNRGYAAWGVQRGVLMHRGARRGQLVEQNYTAMAAVWLAGWLAGRLGGASTAGPAKRRSHLAAGVALAANPYCCSRGGRGNRRDVSRSAGPGLKRLPKSQTMRSLAPRLHRPTLPPPCLPSPLPRAAPRPSAASG